jgi:ketosteroid isomerase-like protein
MSQPNLDLVRTILAAWERGDWSSVEWAHPEIEWVFPDGPEPGTARGLAGMAGFGDFLSTWEDYRVAADEYRELDGERVLVLLNLSGRGKTSGLEIAQMSRRSANVFHTEAGKVTKLAIYWDCDRALADLGLDPEGNSQ